MNFLIPMLKLIECYFFEVRHLTYLSFPIKENIRSFVSFTHVF